MAHLDELEQVLNRLAEDDDPTCDWEIRRNAFTTVIKAATAATFEDRDAAWRAATKLADELVGKALKLRYRSDIGVQLVEPLEEGAPTWRGTVFLNLRPADRVDDGSIWGGNQ